MNEGKQGCDASRGCEAKRAREAPQARVQAYDLMRTFAVVVVFLGHVLSQAKNHGLTIVWGSLSPGLTMSLLGFVSAALLSTRAEEAGRFLVRRFSRIYVSLFVCLAAVMAIQALFGTGKVNRDTALHFLGLSGLFEILPVANHATVGRGLWFVATILGLYVTLPLLKKIFGHKHGLIHWLCLLLDGWSWTDFSMRPGRGMLLSPSALVCT